MAIGTTQHSFSPHKPRGFQPTELTMLVSSDDDSQATLPVSQATLPVSRPQRNEQNTDNEVKRVAGVVFTPKKEAFAQRLKSEGPFESPDARRAIARQERFRRLPNYMGVLSPSATHPRRVFTSPGSVRTVRRTLGQGTQGSVLLTERFFNDSARAPQEEAMKLYDRKCRSWELMTEFTGRDRTYINLPSKIYPTEQGTFAASLPVAEKDLARIDLATEGCPAQKLLGWMRDVAEGVEVMHSHDILHRDIKPANILVLKGRQTAQAADLDLSARVEYGEHYTTCTPYYSHPSIWGNDIMKQKDRKGTQTKADDVYSLGRTMQYGVIGKIFSMHQETRDFVKAMRPTKIDLPIDEREADQMLVELAEQNRGNVMISGYRRVIDLRTRSGYRYVPSLVHVFPSRAMFRTMTLHGIDQLRQKLDYVEFEALRLAADLAHDLQHDDPAQRPSMRSARLQIEANQARLSQLNRPLVLPDLRAFNALPQTLLSPSSVHTSPQKQEPDDNPRETKRRRGLS